MSDEVSDETSIDASPESKTLCATRSAGASVASAAFGVSPPKNGDDAAVTDDIAASISRTASDAAAASERLASSIDVDAPPPEPFYTSERRGRVERRQLALKGAEGGD